MSHLLGSLLFTHVHTYTIECVDFLYVGLIETGFFVLFLKILSLMRTEKDNSIILCGTSHQRRMLQLRTHIPQPIITKPSEEVGFFLRFYAIPIRSYKWILINVGYVVLLYAKTDYNRITRSLCDTTR